MSSTFPVNGGQDLHETSSVLDAAFLGYQIKVNWTTLIKAPTCPTFHSALQLNSGLRTLLQWLHREHSQWQILLRETFATLNLHIAESITTGISLLQV